MFTPIAGKKLKCCTFAVTNQSNGKQKKSTTKSVALLMGMSDRSNCLQSQTAVRDCLHLHWQKSISIRFMSVYTPCDMLRMHVVVYLPFCVEAQRPTERPSRNYQLHFELYRSVQCPAFSASSCLLLLLTHRIQQYRITSISVLSLHCSRDRDNFNDLTESAINPGTQKKYTRKPRAKKL